MTTLRSLTTRCSLLLLCLSLLLVACNQPASEPSSASVPSSAPSSEPASAPVSAEGSSPQAASGGSAVVGIQQDLDSLDPYIANSTGTQEVMFNIFTGLINTDTSGKIVAELASDWQISPDGLSYLFTLRDDVFFHNGDPLRPADVKYSFERLQGKTADQDKPMSTAFDVISAIEVEEQAVRFILSEPDASLLGKLSIAIIPEGSGPQQASHPIGAGPFSFVSYTPGVGIKMAKFDRFYQQGFPKLDAVEFRFFDDSNTAFLALQKGDIDIFNVTLDQHLMLDAERFTVLTTPQNMPQLIAFNLDHEPFNDLRVRQALNHAVDKDEIIEIMAPGSQKLGTNFSEVMEFYAEKGLENTYPFDQKRALELLDEAGQSDLSFTLKVPANYPFHIDTAQIIKEQLGKIGVEMTIDLIEWSTWLSDVYGKFDHEATLVGLTGKLDPDSVLGRFSSTHRNNFMRYANERVDQLLLDGKATSDQDERAVIYKEIQTILAEEVPGIFIMDITLYRAINNRLSPLPTYPIGYIDMKGVSVLE